MDSSDIYNLAGKHTNQNGQSWGTPFDLENFVDDPLVTSGDVDLNQIHYVRIVDIPGSGDFVDSQGNAIYDGWVTGGSGGFDLEALGALNELPDYDGLDTDGDGKGDGDGDVDGDDFDDLADNLGTTALADYARYDLDNDGDVDADDLYYMIATCMQWNNGTQAGYGTLPGDFNLDGAVNAGDLALLAANYGQLGDWGFAQGDTTGDDMINAGDLAALASNYGQNVAVPEPASLTLMSLAGLAVIRRRRR